MSRPCPKCGSPRIGGIGKAYCKPCRGRYAREWQLQKWYEISWEQYVDMYSSQKGECSICSVPIKLESEKRSETACVDHCHKTGKVRSLLCNSCNVLLGAAKDRIDILIKSIEYLKRYE